MKNESETSNDMLIKSWSIITFIVLFYVLISLFALVLYILNTIKQMGAL